MTVGGWISRMKHREKARSRPGKLFAGKVRMRRIFRKIEERMFYNKKWANITVDRFMEIIDNYLCWQNSKRIKLSLGARALSNPGLSLGLAA